MTVNIGPDGTPVAFGDLPESAFPVTMTAWVGDRQLWQRIIRPYEMVDIPGAAEEDRGHVSIHIVYGDGTETWHVPGPELKT